MPEPTVPMHGSAITAHMIRKQYNPTGQVTFFGTIHEKDTEKISATHFQNIEMRHEQHARYTRTTRKEAPAPHGTGASPMLLCR